MTSPVACRRYVTLGRLKTRGILEEFDSNNYYTFNANVIIVP